MQGFGTCVDAGALGDARGRGYPVCRMHTHVTHARVHAAPLAEAEHRKREYPVAPYHESMQPRCMHGSNSWRFRENHNTVNCRAFHLFLAARIFLPLLEH